MQVSHTVVMEGLLPARVGAFPIDPTVYNSWEVVRLIMVPQFDIFRVLSAKENLWIEAAVTLEDAITRVRQIGAVQSGRYFIHSQKTHVEIAITVRRSANVRPKFSTRSEPLTVRLRPRLPCTPRTAHEAVKNETAAHQTHLARGHHEQHAAEAARAHIQDHGTARTARG